MSCNHRRCAGEPCRQYTAQQLQIREQDERKARALMRMGYKQESGKARWVRSGDAYLKGLDIRVFRALKKLGMGLAVHEYPSEVSPQNTWSRPLDVSGYCECDAFFLSVGLLC